ncbi:MAG: phosphatase PAP2 family protein [Aquihabitans sp.]
MLEADSTGPVAPDRAPAEVRPSWWMQIALVAAVWWLYDKINNLSPLRATSALAHGSAILRIETWLHVDAERGLNGWLAAHSLAGRWLGDFYNLAHFVVTIAVLVWVWARHPRRYRSLRNALLGINAIGFLVYWAFPVAPPRMLEGFGFVDIIAVTHSIGAWSTGAFASQANEYAAMPSLHMAWALWCTLAVWSIRTDRPSRAVAVGYSAVVAVVVMATANHYLLDVVAGAATTVVAGAGVFLGAGRLSVLLPWRRRDAGVPGAAGQAPT